MGSFDSPFFLCLYCLLDVRTFSPALLHPVSPVRAHASLRYPAQKSIFPDVFRWRPPLRALRSPLRVCAAVGQKSKYQAEIVSWPRDDSLCSTKHPAELPVGTRGVWKICTRSLFHLSGNFRGPEVSSGPGVRLSRSPI